MSCTKNTCNYLGYTTHNMVKYVWVVVKSWHCVDNIHEYIFNTICNIQYLNLNKNATICKPWLFPAVLLCNCAHSIFKLIWQSTITYSLARWISIHYRYMCIQYLTNIVKQLDNFNLKLIRLCSWENNGTITHVIVLAQAICAFFPTQTPYTGILTIWQCCVCFGLT